MDNDDLTSARILIVDDEPVNVRLLERFLGNAGYRHLEHTTDARRALDLYRSFQPDLILLDLKMPHLDGVAVLQQLGAEIPATAYIPVLVLTADVTLEAKRRALAAGARDFLTKPFEQFEALLRIQNLLDTRRVHLALERHNRTLEDTVRARSERLLQTEKVAAMGSLLAGVAHELNNPLAVLSGQAQLLRATVSDPAVVRRADQIEDAARRCVRIVRNFLALARQQPPERRDTLLNDVVRGAVELLAYELRTDGVEVVLDLADSVPVLWADPHQLHQVLVNLMANAHQAMRRSQQPRRLVLTTRHQPERGRVQLEVADTGPGISPEILAKIFDAFFTTKPAEEGTGLGLTLCQSIVEEHGGAITVHSELGQGARFVVELPVAVRPAPAAETAAPEAAPLVAPKIVLVVDDEPDVADVIVEVLERDGHTVDTATNGAMALEKLAERPYDLVVSDTKMPVLDGEGFYRELERLFPALRTRVIFLTGDVLSRDKQKFLEETGAPHLMKPCDLDEVHRLVRRILATFDK
jgi:signal transduction histidine kinase